MWNNTIFSVTIPIILFQTIPRIIDMPGSKFVHWSWFLIVFFAALNGLTHIYPAASPFVDLLTRPNEQSFIEYAEAFLWISSCIGFSLLFYTQVKNKGAAFLKISYFTLALMSFLVFGEETSWGQHFGLVSPSEEVQEINAQKEFNLHNTNLSKVLKLSEDNPLYEKLSNAGNLVSPLFQMFCVTAFGLIPLLYRKKPSLFPSFMAHYPHPSRSVSFFVILCFILYLIINNLLFNVAIIVELAMALTGFMVVMDRRYTDKISLKLENGTTRTH